jgi:nicotinamidase-related amidase
MSESNKALLVIDIQEDYTVKMGLVFCRTEHCQSSYKGLDNFRKGD